MRKFLFIAAVALLGTLGLSACHNNDQSQASSAEAKATKPTSATDIKGWQAYLNQIVENNMGDITNTPYLYFVPAASDPASNATLGRVQQQVNETVAATVLPGNMVAIGGPSSATTANVIETAFKTAATGSFKGVVVLFIGDKADEAAVKAAVAPSGATFKFAQM
ncbi:MAG TPA: hypothetical protein VF284_07805 [Rhodanobacteraceae bacterium]